MHVRRNRVDDVAALVDNLVDPDRVLLLKRLSLISHGAHGQAGHVEGVDAVPGRRARVGLPAHKHGVLADKAVARVAGRQAVAPGADGEVVDHHTHVRVVKSAAVGQLRLAAEIVKLSLPAQPFPVVHLNVLLRGNRHKVDLSVQLVKQARVGKRVRDPVHHRGLNIVAAGVDRSGPAVAVRVVQADHGVQLPHHHHLWPLLVGVCPGSAPGNRDIPLRLKPQRFQRIRQGLCGLYLPVAGLRVLVDFPSKGQVNLPPLVNGLDGFLF